VKLRMRLGWAAGIAGLAGVLLAGCGAAAAPLVVRVADGGPARSLQLALPACAGQLPAPGLLLVRPFEPGRGEEGTAG
jgi:hypothetical protein